MTRIAVDLDGVTYDFTASLRHYLVEFHGYDSSTLPDAQVWDFFTHQWGITTEQFLSFCAQGVDAGVIFGHGEPIEGAVEFLNRFRADGHTIHIATSRFYGSQAAGVTERWLNEHKVPYDSLCIVRDKWLVDADVYIDDHGKNFDEIWEYGKPCFLFDQPWNSHVDAGSYRVGSWKEFYEAVSDING